MGFAIGIGMSVCGKNGGSGGGGSSPVSLIDTFVGTNGTAIQSHTPTPSGGFSWSVGIGAGEIQSNKLNSVTSGTTMLIHAGAASADGDGGVYVTVPGSGKFCAGMAFRVVSASSYLVLAYTNDDSTNTYLSLIAVGGG